MKFDRVPTYTAKELESMAPRLLNDTLGADFTTPVDVELVLDRIEGVTYDLWPGLRANHQTEGMVCRDVGTGQIRAFVDDALAGADHLVNRYRMTVAEEAGHVTLHRNIIEQIEGPDDFVALQRHAKWHEMDRNAKRFAAALLMPSERLLAKASEWYPKLVAVAGFNDVNAVLKYLATKLAIEFQVSPQTMTYRLGEYPASVADRVRAAMSSQTITL